MSPSFLPSVTLDLPRLSLAEPRGHNPASHILCCASLRRVDTYRIVRETGLGGPVSPGLPTQVSACPITDQHVTVCIVNESLSHTGLPSEQSSPFYPQNLVFLLCTHTPLYQTRHVHAPTTAQKTVVKLTSMCGSSTALLLLRRLHCRGENRVSWLVVVYPYKTKSLRFSMAPSLQSHPHFYQVKKKPICSVVPY